MKIVVPPALRNWEPLSRTRKFNLLFETVGPDIEETIRDAFTVWLALYLQAEVVDSIKNQRNMSGFTPLSKKYAEQKRKSGGASGFWRNTYSLASQITVWKEDAGALKQFSAIVVGIPDFSHDNRDIIAQVLEQGNTRNNLPARPLFTRTMSKASKNISTLFTIFIKNKFPSYYHLIS